MDERTLRDDYAAIPYLSKAEPLTHPELLWATGWVRGMNPALPEQARVLEIGCGDGANLVGLGWALPDAKLTGLDRSGPAIARGRAAVEALSLENVRLHEADIEQVKIEPGTFDYVIAHGFASWVPERVFEAALAVARRALAPEGLLYVSYNVRPAWGMRGAIRDAMMRAAAPLRDPKERVGRARAVVELMLSTLGEPDPSDHHANVLYRELILLRASPDFAVLHDYLSPDNRAYSLDEMVAATGRHGLSLLEELRPLGADPRVWTQRRHQLAEVTRDPVLAELMSDVLNRRAFRASLFRVRETPLSSPRNTQALLEQPGVRLATTLKPVTTGGETSAVWQTPDGQHLRVDEPTLARALGALASSWPHASTVDEVLARAGAIEGGRAALVRWLAELRRAGHVELRRGPRRCAAEISERPRASALARFEAKHRSFLTSVDHQPVAADDATRGALLSLDGAAPISELKVTEEQLDELHRRGLLEA